MKIFYFIISFCMYIGIHAQEGFPVYNAYLFDNFFSMHSSHAGIADCSRVRLTGRSQWAGVENNPQVFAVNYDTRIHQNGGAGILIFNDRNGFTEKNGVQLTYAHHLNFDHPEVKTNTLSMALTYNLYNFNTRKDKLILQGAGSDPVFAMLDDNFLEHNLNVSFSYFYKDFFASFTAYSLLPFFKNKFTSAQSINARNYLFTAGNTFQVNRKFWVEPSVTYFTYEAFDGKSHIDINSKVYFNNENMQLSSGLSYRAFTFGEKTWESALLTPFVGLKWKDFSLAYSYDIQLNSINDYYPSSHQFSLGINFGCGNRKKHCNCPYF